VKKKEGKNEKKVKKKFIILMILAKYFILQLSKLIKKGAQQNNKYLCALKRIKKFEQKHHF
jgi:hypothetical protein